MALSLAGKHCAVVGATGIIGTHIAKAFAREGAVVSLLGRTALQSRSKLQDELRPFTPSSTAGAGGGDAQGDAVPSAHQFIRLDVSSRDDIKHVFGSRHPSSVCVPFQLLPASVSSPIMRTTCTPL